MKKYANVGNEIWKVVEDYPKYKISNMGNVTWLNKPAFKRRHVDGYLQITPKVNYKPRYIKCAQACSISFYTKYR